MMKSMKARTMMPLWGNTNQERKFARLWRNRLWSVCGGVRGVYIGLVLVAVLRLVIGPGHVLFPVPEAIAGKQTATKNDENNKALPVGSPGEERCFALASKKIGTMKSLNKITTVLEVARRTAPVLSGDFVEAGVAEGGGCLPVLFYLACSGHLQSREFHLFDTWEGLPASDAKQDKGFEKGAYLKTVDVFRKNVEAWGEYYENKKIIDSSNDVAASQSFVYSWDEARSRLKTHVGLFADTMPGVLASRSLAALYCDGDMYQSSLDCLAGAGPRLQDGGWIYHDDYYTFSGNYQAVNDWIAQAGARHSPLQVVPQSGSWRPVAEDPARCSPPTDNSDRSGTCDGSGAEACFWQVKA